MRVTFLFVSIMFLVLYCPVAQSEEQPQAQIARKTGFVQSHLLRMLRLPVKNRW